MYIKKKDRELFANIDNNLSLPADWNSFIKEKLINNRLIIKTKKNYKCGNCNYIFDSEIKVNEYCKCPNCKNSYLVKSNRLTYHEFRDDLAILDKYDNYYIVRAFRLITEFKDNDYHYYNFEYGRKIYNKKFELIEEIINDNVVGNIGGWYISYREDNSKNWKYFNTWRYSLPDKFMYYPYNLKEILSDREDLKYSMLWELAKYVSCDLIYLINNYSQSIELLTKLKLYNLALCPNTFQNKKTFEDRFMGLTKDYIPFIQEFNLDIDELIALSYLKIKDINYIRRLKYLDKDNLEYLKKNVNLKILLDKTDFGLKSRFHEYKDYLILAKKLKLNLKDKKILYPKNITKAHDKLLNEYEQKKDKILNNKIKKRFKELENNTFQNNKYIIFPAKDMNALIEESSQQNNCVRTYAERIADGECDIYFMRLIKDQTHSLVTVEVKNSKIAQKRIKNNGITTKAQDKFLNLWEQVVLQK